MIGLALANWLEENGYERVLPIPTPKYKKVSRAESGRHNEKTALVPMSLPSPYAEVVVECEKEVRVYQPEKEIENERQQNQIR